MKIFYELGNCEVWDKTGGAELNQLYQMLLILILKST